MYHQIIRTDGATTDASFGLKAPIHQLYGLYMHHQANGKKKSSAIDGAAVLHVSKPFEERRIALRDSIRCK